jgi:hypothetical protein
MTESCLRSGGDVGSQPSAHHLRAAGEDRRAAMQRRLFELGASPSHARVRSLAAYALLEAGEQIDQHIIGAPGT